MPIPNGIAWVGSLEPGAPRGPGFRQDTAPGPGGTYLRQQYTDGRDRAEFVIDPTGSRIWASWTETVALEEITALLMSSVLGSVLLLRGVTCLHGSAVRIGPWALALIPSVFLGLNRDLPSGCALLALAEVALATLQEGPLVPALRQNLERSFLACTNRRRVSHVGVMLARQVEPLRLNSQCSSAESILPYLEGLGWPGPLHEVEALLARTGSFVDALTVCLDVGRQIYPRLGLAGGRHSGGHEVPAGGPHADRMVARFSGPRWRQR